MVTQLSKADRRSRDLLKEEVIRYIGKCRLPDGGYFFARVTPSSGMDTYYAVKSLSLLGVKPGDPGSIVDFFFSMHKAGALNGTTGIFAAVETLDALGGLDSDIKQYAAQYITSLQNKAGGFGATENVDIEVISELQETYRAVKVLTTVNAVFDRQKVKDFLLGWLNPDGSYGRGGHSALSSTYYAVAIYKLLDRDMRRLAVTRDFLREQERNRQVGYIEDLYRLIMGLADLGEKTGVPDRAVNFVLECRRAGGGFARAMEMGIPTLEYTYYALSILKATSVLDSLRE